jgi:hypothetical protein
MKTKDGGLGDEFEAIVNAIAQHQALLDLSIDRASALTVVDEGLAYEYRDEVC